MYKCPKCGGKLSPHGDGLWKCEACGGMFRMTLPQENKPADKLNATQQRREDKPSAAHNERSGNQGGTIGLLKVKAAAKQFLKEHYKESLLPIGAAALWGLILAAMIVCSVLILMLANFIAGIILIIPSGLFAVFVVYALRIKTAQYYLNTVRGQDNGGLRSFFNFKKVVSKIWKLIALDILTVLLSFMFIFMPTYTLILYSIKMQVINDVENKKVKEYLELIPSLANDYVLNIAIVKISFFWWYLLSLITCGIVYLLYVKPYKSLTQTKIYFALTESYNRKYNTAAQEGGICEGAVNMLSAGADKPAAMTFEKYIQEFCGLEKEVSGFLTFEHNYAALACNATAEYVNELRRVSSAQINYKRAAELNRKSAEQLRSICKKYEKLSETVPVNMTEAESEYCDTVTRIVQDRISVLRLEIITAQKKSSGQAIKSIKSDMAALEQRENRQNIAEAYAAQLNAARRKKRIKTGVVAAALCCCIVAGVLIGLLPPYNSITENGITYERVVIDGREGYEITSAYGASGDVTIKDAVRGLPVISIGEGAFSSCGSLTSVTIPDSVINIGDSAFSSCGSLTSVTIPDSVINIGDGAFIWCHGLISVTIGDSVTSIGNAAFSCCDRLTSVTIPDSVMSIGEQAFYSCSELTSVTIGDGVLNIGRSAFLGCNSLESITIPFVGATKGGTEDTHFGYIFGASDFIYNINSVPGSLKEVVITGGTSIGEVAFFGCSGLTSVTIPDSVTSIGYSAFAGCSSLESMTIPFVGAEAGKTSPDTYQYPFGYIFGTSSYTGGMRVMQVVYHGSSTSGATSDYYYIPSSLRSVTVTGGNILYGAFYNCSMLTSVTISDGVTSIGDYAFYNCSGLTSVTIPDSVMSIGEYAFRYCRALETIKFSGTVEEWNNVEKAVNQAGAGVQVICTNGSELWFY